MDLIHLAIFAVGAGLVIGGARMLYCGHKSIRNDRHDRRATPDRRGEDRHADRRHVA